MCCHSVHIITDTARLPDPAYNSTLTSVIAYMPSGLPDRISIHETHAEILDTATDATEHETLDDIPTPSSRKNERPARRTPKGKGTAIGSNGLQKWRKSKGKLLLQNAEAGVW